MRTHYCGKVTEEFIGKTVELCGWVNRIRNHGKIIFIDLRDREGLIQAVVDDVNFAAFSLASDLHNESVIKIIGEVRARPEGLVNKEITTGGVEVAIKELQLLSKADVLPFNVNAANEQEISEDLRLRYRYLDLRNPDLLRKMKMRAAITSTIRNYFDKHDFLDIETPILTKSTPEGARDYLVPSRVHKGKFYALPQSPQIFKQLLMAAGMDRYYQIARCFRDEDLRADRQPEFTQLDVEMSFINELDIQNIIEGLFKELFAKILEVAIKVPFPRLTYHEVMQRYGSDKPDLRIPLEFVEIADLVKDVDFAAFKKCTQNTEYRIAALRLPGGSDLSRKQIDGFNEFVALHGAKGVFTIKVNDMTQGVAGIQSSLAKFLPPQTLEQIVNKVRAINGDMVFIIADKEKIVNEALGALRVKLGHERKLITEHWVPLWVVDFPMFEEKDEAITFLHHPFTAPRVSSPEELVANPLAAKARAYDMVLNGYELGGGSMRIWNTEMQLAVFKVIGIDEGAAWQKFGHLLDAFKYGYPPEGGIAFGLDRIAMLLSGATSIRDVIAFPKNQSATCVLMDAPSEVSEAQLKELGVKVDAKV